MISSPDKSELRMAIAHLKALYRIDASNLTNVEIDDIMNLLAFIRREKETRS